MQKAGPRLKREARTFVLGAGTGFITGAFVVAAAVWQFGNVIGSRAASLRYPPGAPAAVERWKDTLADADTPVLEHDGPPPVATTGSGAAAPAANPEPAIGASPESIGELADRDLLIPVDGVGAGDLVRSFDEERGGSRQHQAIDILAPRNTPVKAIEDGRIARLFLSKAGGTTIYQFDPTEQFCYYYAHLERYADGLREGDRIRKGQVIGYVGTSGNAPRNTPHLHFAVFRLTGAKRWWEGTPLDPYDVLR